MPILEALEYIIDFLFQHSSSIEFAVYSKIRKKCSKAVFQNLGPLSVSSPLEAVGSHKNRHLPTGQAKATATLRTSHWPFERSYPTDVASSCLLRSIF